MPFARSPLEEAWQFLYPEEGPGGVQREVWQNPSTGEYQYRNESPLPGYNPDVYEGPRASTDELLGLRQLQESRYPDIAPIGNQSPPMPTPPPPIPNPLEGAGDWLGEMLGYQAKGIGTAAEALSEPFEIASPLFGLSRKYGASPEGAVATALSEAQQFPPILSTAPQAAEVLFGTTIKELGGLGMLRASELFNTVVPKAAC